MGFLADLLIRIGGDASDLKRELSSARKDLQAWGKDLEGIGQKLTLGMTVPLLGLGTAALKVAGELEQNTVAFKTMMGSADLAQKHLNELKDFALKTPFQFTELTLASKRMQALGFAAKEVIPTLTNIGDAAAALGMGAEGLDRIVTALGQMKAKGKVQAEEMRQLAEAGIPAWQILAKTLNTDVAGAMKAVEARAVDASIAVPALLAGMNAKFGGLMAEQAKTLLGKFSNMKDAITFTLQDIGKTLAPMAQGIMDNLLQPVLDGLKNLAAGFALLPSGMQSATVGILAFLAAVGPASWAMGATANGLRDFLGIAMKLPALLTPVGLAIAGLAIGAGIALFDLHERMAVVSARYAETAKLFAESLTKIANPAADLTEKQVRLEESFRKGRISIEDYKTGLSQLDALERKMLLSQDFVKSRKDIQAAIDNDAIGMAEYVRLMGTVADREKQAFNAKVTNDIKAMTLGFAEQGVSIKVVSDNTKVLASDTEALAALNLRSTAERKKDLADARAAYAFLAKSHSEGSQVMAEALLRVKQAEEALTGETTMKIVDHFGKASRATLESMVITEQYNRALAAQKKLISDIVDARNNAFQNAWHSILPMDKLPDLKGVLDTKVVDETEKSMAKLITTFEQLPPEMKQWKEDLAAFGLAGESIDSLEVRLGRLKQRQEEGRISLDTYNRAMLKFLKDEDAAGRPLNLEQRKLAIELEKQYGHQIKETSKIALEFQREVERTFNAVARGIARSIVDWKGFKDTVINIGKDLAAGFLEIMIRQLIKPLEKQFAALALQLGKVLFPSATSAAGGVLGTTVGAAGGAAGTIAGGAAKVGGGVASSAGSAASTIGGIAGTMNIVGAVSAAVGAVSSIVGNFQMAGMNKSLDIIVKHTLQTANDLANLRVDAWAREAHLMVKLDDMWNAIRDTTSAVMKGGVGGGGKGGVIVNFYAPVNGSAAEIANAIFNQAKLAGAI